MFQHVSLSIMLSFQKLRRLKFIYVYLPIHSRELAKLNSKPELALSFTSHHFWKVKFLVNLETWSSLTFMFLVGFHYPMLP